MKTHLHILFFFIALIFPANSFSQGNQRVPLEHVSKQEADSLIINYCSLLQAHYFDKTKAKEIEKILMKKLKSEEFYGLPTKELTDRLSLLLRDLTHDLHFYVGVQETAHEPEETSSEDLSAEEAPQNYTSGFTEVKLLENNIGYIRWTEFIATDISFRKFIAALTFLEGCDYLIVDISKCPGGDGRMGAFVNHHLYEGEDYQNVLQKKCGGENEWHPSEVPYHYSNGPGFQDIPVFIITSKNTGSAAEYFALTAQETKRAVILGETTAGAGNPVIMVTFGNYFAYVPVCEIRTASGRSIEGKGVAPDVLLKSDQWVDETVKYILKN